MKSKSCGTVISQTLLSDSIYDLRIKTNLAKEAKPGQFVALFTKDRSKLLPRPISICGADGDELRLVYRVTGKDTGTEEFSKLKAGDEISLLGVLGNGYDLSKTEGKNVVLMGGGIGIPPMLELFKSVVNSKKAKSVKAVLGYRDAKLFLKEDFDKIGDTYICTEDGSLGIKGNVLDVMNSCADIDKNDLVICACGPMPMLRAIKRYAEGVGAEAYISLEERMACGVGACLGCICKTVNKDAHSHVNNARICTDGPVFNAADIDM